jgi:tetratricopeptide (TPR) repeat protein
MSFSSRFLLLFPAALLLVAVACQSDEEKVTAFMARGDAAVEAERAEEAVIEYRNVLQINPNHAAAHYALARSYTSLQKLKEAYWELHESVRLDPENTDARVSYAQFSLIARDYEEVLTQAEEIVARQPERASAYTLRGEAYSALERYDEAEASFEKAIETAEEADVPAHLANMVQFQSRRANFKAARPYLDRLVELDPNFRSYASLGRHQTRAGEFVKAEAAFKKSLELANKHKETAYRNLAGFYFNRQRPDEAVSTLEEGIEAVTEGKLDLIYLLARFHASQGDQEAADALVARATEDAGDDPQPWLVLSSYRSRQGDIPGAIEAVDRALEVDPENTAARLRKAELLVDSGYREKKDEQIAAGREIVDGVLSEEPSNPHGLFVRAKIEMAELDPKAAAQTLRAALDVRPDWAQARFVLGSALMLIGDQNGARAELARAVELDPGQLESRRSLARIHASLGEHEYAIEQGRMYLRERPNDTRTQILVAQSLVHLGKRDEAFAELERIREEDRDADSWYAIGRLYMAQGKTEEARTALLAADAERPNMPDILRSLLRLEATTGRIGLSAERIRSAVEAEPNNGRLALLEGRVALVENDHEAAEAAFKRAVELDPDDAVAYQHLASFYRQTDRLDESIETYQRSLEQNPDSARLNERLAILFEFSGNREKAMEHYERAISLDSSLGESKNNLAYLLAENEGDLDRALDLAQEAKALLPDNPNTADTLGWVLFKRGIPSAAIGYLREAMAGFSGDDDALGIVSHHLALAYEANEQPDKALETLDAAITRAGRMEQGGRKPGWAGDVRSMADRLRAASS